MDIYEDKVRSILDWMRVIFHKRFDYAFVDLRSGEIVRSSSERPYPGFRRDTFTFLLMNHFIPLGLPYLFFRYEGYRFSTIGNAWQEKIKRFAFDGCFFYTDIYAFLKTPDHDAFTRFLMDHFMRNEDGSLMESLLHLFILTREASEPGSFYRRMDESILTPELFYSPLIPAYLMLREEIEGELLDVVDRCFYLTMREERLSATVGMDRIVSLEKLSHLEPLLEEPFFYTLEEYRKSLSQESRLKRVMTELIGALRETRDPFLYRFSRREEERFNLENSYLERLFHPVRFSSFEYETVIVTRREGVEREWELALSDERRGKTETVYRCDSIEETFLFAVVNGIDWKKGVKFVTAPGRVTSRASKLWNNIESWYNSDETVFIGMNYTEERKERGNYYFISSMEDILNVGEDEESFITEMSLFVKSRDLNQIQTFNFREQAKVSPLLSMLAEQMPLSEDGYRISMCYDPYYRPVLNRIEGLLRMKIELPFIIRENGRFNLILQGEYAEYDNFTDLLDATRDRGVTRYTVDNVGEGMEPYRHMTQQRKEQRTQIFYMGPEIREIAVFFAGSYAGGYRLGRRNFRPFMVSLFTFLNSLSVLVKKDIDFEMVSYDTTRENYFLDVKSSIEFESLQNKKSILGMSVNEEKAITLHYRDKSYSAESVDILIDRFVNENPRSDCLIGYCRNFKVESINPFTMLRMKLILENRMFERKEEMEKR